MKFTAFATLCLTLHWILFRMTFAQYSSKITETPKVTDTETKVEEVTITLPDGRTTVAKKKTTYYTTKWNTTRTSVASTKVPFQSTSGSIVYKQPQRIQTGPFEEGFGTQQGLTMVRRPVQGSPLYIGPAVPVRVSTASPPSSMTYSMPSQGTSPYYTQFQGPGQPVHVPSQSSYGHNFPKYQFLAPEMDRQHFTSHHTASSPSTSFSDHANENPEDGVVSSVLNSASPIQINPTQPGGSSTTLPPPVPPLPISSSPESTTETPYLQVTPDTFEKEGDHVHHSLIDPVYIRKGPLPNHDNQEKGQSVGSPLVTPASGTIRPEPSVTPVPITRVPSSLVANTRRPTAATEQVQGIPEESFGEFDHDYDGDDDLVKVPEQTTKLELVPPQVPKKASTAAPNPTEDGESPDSVDEGYSFPTHASSEEYDSVPPSPTQPKVSLKKNPVRPVSSNKGNHLRVKYCPPLRDMHAGVVMQCTGQSSPGRGSVGVIPCSERQAVGNQVKYSCLAYYESSTGRPTMTRTCKPDGTWTGASRKFTCMLQCGIANIIKTAFITSGQRAEESEWPWNTALLEKRVTKTGSSWEFICGGTLISEGVVLTAAHCVTKFGTSETKKAENFRLEFGKYMRKEVSEFVQAKHVRRIVVHESYNAHIYDSDIAMMMLDKPVDIGYHVRPICYPISGDSALEELHLSTDSMGTVVGWGQTETGKLADVLQYTRLPVVSPAACLENIRDSHITKVQTRSTTYCAGYKNGTNVCMGDSGAGMYFPAETTDSTRWYLQGIVSVGITDRNRRCDPKKYSIFTRVGRYAEWINRMIDGSVDEQEYEDDELSD